MERPSDKDFKPVGSCPRMILQACTYICNHLGLQISTAVEYLKRKFVSRSTKTGERSVVMTTQLITKNIDTQIREHATELTAEVQDRHVLGTILDLDDGTQLQLSKTLSDLVVFVLDGLTQGDLRIQSLPEELTTKTAADILGVSRPTLMKMVQDGVLKSHKVGSHHRFTLRHVMDLKSERKRRRANSFAQLRELELECETED